ncbi:MAG TPA: phage tail protein [Candidatus Tumulicola sp.]
MNSDEIAALLPAVFRAAVPTDPTLQVLLDVMASHVAPVENRLTNLSEIFDAVTSEEAFVAMLALWVDLGWLFASDDDDAAVTGDWSSSTIDPGRLRMLIETSHRLSQERGTADGLVRFLETATGVKGFEVANADPDAAPFHLQVRVPAAASGQMNLIVRIVNAEKPAYTTWEAVTA